MSVSDLWCDYVQDREAIEGVQRKARMLLGISSTFRFGNGFSQLVVLGRRLTWMSTGLNKYTNMTTACSMRS